MTVAARVLERGDLTLAGSKLHVAAPRVFRWDEKSVEVHGVDDTVSTSVLQLMFENRKRSGGGKIDKIDRYGDFAVVHYLLSAGRIQINISSMYEPKISLNF